MAVKGRILTGDRPTGRMHLGHYVGSLANRVRLQDEYECFFIVADLHTLTTKPEREAIAAIGNNVHEMVLDYLSVGIDPEKSTIFLQSGVYRDLRTQPDLRDDDQRGAAGARAEPEGHGDRRQPGLDAVRLARLSRCCKPPTSCCRAPTSSRSARTTSRTSKSRARSPGASISCTGRRARRRHLPDPRRADRRRAFADRDGRAGQDEQVARQRHLPERRREDRQREGARHVHRPEPHPRRHPRSRRGQPGLHLPRRLQPERRGGQRPEGALPARARSATWRSRRSWRWRSTTSSRRCASAAPSIEAQPGLVEDVLIAGTERARAEAQKTMALVREAMGMYRLPVKIR